MKKLLTAAAALLMVGALAGCDPDTGTSGAPATTAQATQSAPAATSGPGSAPATTAAKSTPTLPNRDDVNVDARDFESQGHYYFQSPSTNIKCGIYVDNIHTVGCQLKNATVIPAGLSCANNPGHSVAAQVRAGTAEFVCLNQGVYVGPPTDGSTAPGFHEGGGKVLEYGQTIGVRGVICESMQSGVRCTVDGHGFVIAADAQSLF
ncbi:hypothetical protein VMT65_19155 [Nocardia sp. CDC153]|uniref:hypothetical protein n=1 Tax=Nocardia sp. CDC153 TaxID=3112167 RepID=UPI002DBDC676|nr:hypothetical protein [Nocardia sp. CDC153]MEC3955168.1 hypothetical protein [Nocardia sp. CDC153]